MRKVPDATFYTQSSLSRSRVTPLVSGFLRQVFLVGVSLLFIYLVISSSLFTSTPPGTGDVGVSPRVVVVVFHPLVFHGTSVGLPGGYSFDGRGTGRDPGSHNCISCRNVIKLSVKRLPVFVVPHLQSHSEKTKEKLSSKLFVQ